METSVSVVSSEFFQLTAIYLVFGLFLLIAIFLHRRVPSSKTLEAYKERHPELVKDGRIKCFSCGGKRIGVERLMQQTYRRRHYCQSCGTTLYETKEK